MNRLYALNFRLFVSLKLTIAIFIGLGIALFSGMFWDQTALLEDHFANITSPIIAKIFLLFEMYDVYHSWWFGVLILLLALNLIACSIARLPNIWIDAKRPLKKINDSIFKKASQKKVLNVKHLKIPLFSKNEETWKENGIQYFFYEQHPFARCGVYIVHSALLFIMFGSIIVTQLGISGLMNIQEGKSSQNVLINNAGKINKLHQLNFLVHCNQFKLKTHTDESPFEYESDLSIYSLDDNKSSIINKTIKVNEPLEYGGYTFYQSSYNTIGKPKSINISVANRSKDNEDKFTNYHIQIGETVQIKGTNDFADKIKILEYFEDYANFGSAIRLEHDNSQFVVFKKYPEFDAEVRNGKFNIIFNGLDWNFSTGISVTKSPGISIVFTGFAIMFIGLYITFGMNQRRYYAKAIPTSSERFELILAGICNRYPQAFKKEFEQIVNQYKFL